MKAINAGPQFVMALHEGQQADARFVKRTLNKGVKRYRIPGHVHPSAVSQWKHGGPSLPLSRMRAMLAAMANAGHPRAHGQLMADRIAAMVDEFWPVDAVDFDAALIAAQEADSSEDAAEVAALVKKHCDESWSDYLCRLEDFLARGKVVADALRLRLRRKAAA